MSAQQQGPPILYLWPPQGSLPSLTAATLQAEASAAGGPGRARAAAAPACIPCLARPLGPQEPCRAAAPAPGPAGARLPAGRAPEPP
jgi:hypothetical protein